MGEEAPKVNQTYDQIKEFMKQIKEDAEISHKIDLIKKDLKNFVNETKINTMIQEAIEKNQENIDKKQEAIDKIKTSGFQWGPMIERIITTAIIAIIVGLVMRGFNV